MGVQPMDGEAGVCRSIGNGLAELFCPSDGAITDRKIRAIFQLPTEITASSSPVAVCPIVSVWTKPVGQLGLATATMLTTSS